MKSYSYHNHMFGIVIFAAIVHCAVVSDRSTRNLVPRQAGYIADSQIGKAPVYSVETLAPKTNKNAVRKKIRFGPYTVPGSQEPSVGKLSDAEDKVGALAIVDRIESLCGGDCSILWGVGIPEFENGTAITTVGGSIYNNHVFALNRERLVSSHICPGDPNLAEKYPDTVINSQTDQEVTKYTSSDGKVKSGYAIKSTDRIDLLAEFMNYRTEGARVNIAFDFEYIPGKPEGYLNTQGIMFSGTPCNQIAFNVPTKQYTLSSNKWIIPVNLTLINARGHQHDGGVGIQIFVNGKQVCSTVLTYAKMESRGKDEEIHYTIREMSLYKPQVELKKGESLVIKSDYDVEKYLQRQSNTGYIETVAAMVSVVLELPLSFDVANL